ncbi:FHA domain-containing protein [bacterium]|nr:FHA domain-containing protein [bacterium]
MAKMLNEGDTVRGAQKYIVVRSRPDQVHFAQGGQGTLYKTQVNDDPSNILLLKQISDPTALSPDGKKFLNRYYRIRDIFASIPTFVPTIHDIFECDEIYYISYQLLEGKSLDEMLTEWTTGSDFPEKKRKLISVVMAFTLSQVHNKGLIHLDLKPDNVFIEQVSDVQFKTRLIDFSSAIVEGAPDPDVIYGTAGYWSPEHLKENAKSHVGKHSDVFTLSIILFPLLTEKEWSPFDWGGDAELYKKQVLNRDAKKAIDVNPKLPGGKIVSDLLWRMISPDVGERPSSKEVHEVLKNELMPKPVPPSPPIPLPPIEPKPKPDPVPPAPEKEKGTLVLDIGNRKLTVTSDMILGRKEMRGFLGYEYLNNGHARLYFDTGSGVWVISQVRDTVNPTLVNSTPCKKYIRVPLSSGDEIKVGNFVAKITIS